MRSDSWMAFNADCALFSLRPSPSMYSRLEPSLFKIANGRQAPRQQMSAWKRVHKKCEHNREWSCGGDGICQHNRRWIQCKGCGGPAPARVTTSGTGARNAGVPVFGSITAAGSNARTARAPITASMPESGTPARTAGLPSCESMAEKELLPATAGALACAPPIAAGAEASVKGVPP